MTITEHLQNKVAVITGAAREGGIGRAIARTLTRQGAHIVISDIGKRLDLAPDYQVATSEELTEARIELERLGAKVADFACDITKPDQVSALIQFTVETFGRLDIMVCNAGVSTENVPIEHLSLDAFDQTVSVNLRGTFLCMQAAIRQMKSQGSGGRIINISSQAGKTGWPLLGAYCASKFGVNGLTQVAAKEVGRDGITVNAVCPGTLDNPLNDLPGGLWDAYSSAMGVSREAVRSSTLEAIPLGRFQTPEDVADLVGFLASEEARYITGQAINTTGGQEMH